MSIETLPNELLVKICSHCSWVSRCNLSLVNRRWYQVIGQKATLSVSRKGIRGGADVCIPMEVLCGSLREYSQFSCSMLSMDSQMMRETFGTALEYCYQRWNMNSLRIASSYNRFKIFLQHYKHVLNDVVRTDISVYGNVNCYFREKDTPITTHFVLQMEKLRQLSLVYIEPSVCSLSVHAPKLEFLKIDRSASRYVWQNKFRLTSPNSSRLRTVLITGASSPSRDSDPEELQSILAQAPNMTRLEIACYTMAPTISAIPGNLQTITFKDVTITPADAPLDCFNLTKLQLSDVKLRKPLKLRVPKLNTLICDIKALRSLHLLDAFEADLLAIDLTVEQSVRNEAVTTFPTGLSSFGRLHLLLWNTEGIDDTNVSWLWKYLSGITELTLQANSMDRYFHRLRTIWNQLRQITSVRLLGMEVPDNFNFLPVNVWAVSIRNCCTEASGIVFPSRVEHVWITNLWKSMKDISGSARVVLLPPNRYMPLEFEMVLVEEQKFCMGWLAYSTKNHPDDLENIFPLPPRNDALKRIDEVSKQRRRNNPEFY